MKREYLELLKPFSHSMRLQKDEFLFMEGDVAENFYWVESGEVRLYTISLNGKENEIGRFKKGESIGAALAFAQSPYPHFAQVTQESYLWVFPISQCRSTILSDPQLAEFFLDMLAKKCIHLSTRMNTLQLENVRSRLLQYLSNQCPKDGACAYRLPVTKKDLAQILGTSAETLSRTFSALQQEGLIETSGRNVILTGCARQCDHGPCGD